MITLLTAIVLLFLPIQTDHTIDPVKTPSATDKVYKSLDGGLTWLDVSDGLPAEWNSNNLVTIGNDIFLSGEKSLYMMNNQQSKWEKDAYMKEQYINIYASKSGLYGLSYEKGFFQKLEGTEVWIPTFPQLRREYCRTFLETQNGDFLVGCDRGIMKSSDGGKSWNLVLEEFLVLNIVEDKGVLLVSSPTGIFQSRDQSKSWNKVMSKASAVRKLAKFGDRIVGIINNVNTEETSGNRAPTPSMLYSTIDQGNTWQRMDDNLSHVHLIFQNVAEKSKVQNIIDVGQAGSYLFCSLDTGIFRSNDNGKTWELVLASNDEKTYRLTSSGSVIYAVKANMGC